MKIQIIHFFYILYYVISKMFRLGWRHHQGDKIREIRYIYILIVYDIALLYDIYIYRPIRRTFFPKNVT